MNVGSIDLIPRTLFHGRGTVSCLPINVYLSHNTCLLYTSHHPDDPSQFIPNWHPAPHDYQAEPERAKEYPLTVTTGRRIPVYLSLIHI